MELFRLLGTIAIENSEANKSMDETTEKAEKSESRMTSAFKKIGAAIVSYFAVDKIIAFGKACTEAFEIQEQAELKLETIMKQRMKSTDEQIQKIKDLTSAQQQLGVVGDEVQLAGAQQLATFLSTEKALETLIPAMNNLAVQQNGYNVSSEAMVSIGNMMGKVMQGQTSALTRVGITFTEAQERMLKYGNEEQRAATLAQVITDNVGEMNSVLAKTDSGRIQQAKNNFGDMQEMIGQKLMPVVAAFYDVVNELALFVMDNVLPIFDKVSKWAEEHQQAMKVIMSVLVGVAAGITAVVAGMAALKAAMAIASLIKGVTAAMAGLNLAMTANPIGLVVAAIAALVIALTALGVAIYKNWDSIKAWCADIGKKVKDTFVNLGNHVKDAAVSVKKSIDDNFPAAGKAIDKTMEAASKTVSEKLSNIKKAFDDNGGGIKGTVAAAFEAVKGYHTAGFTFIDNLTGNKLSGLATSFRDKFTEIKNNVSSKLENLKTDFGTKLEEITNNGRNLLNTLGNSFSNTFENAKGVVQKAIEKIKGFMDFEWKLPDIKLPHFKITPKDWKFSDLLEGETPYLSIEWYKNGGIMNKPTMFGFNPASSSAMVGGEAGAEAIAPIDKLQQYVSDAVVANNAIIADAFNDGVVRIIDFLQRNNNNTNMQVVLDSGTLVGELAPALDSKLGNMVNKRNRGN